MAGPRVIRSPKGNLSALKKEDAIQISKTSKQLSFTRQSAKMMLACEKNELTVVCNSDSEAATVAMSIKNLLNYKGSFTMRHTKNYWVFILR